jgi:hypothetical protein
MTVSSTTTGTLAAGIYITSGAALNTLIVATNTENPALSGTGGIGTYFVNISQTVASTVMTGVGAGYVKVTGTYGLVIPSGTSSNRPALAYTEVGMVRYNTDQQYVEVFNGISWASVAGASSGVSLTQANDIAVQITLTLG